MKTIKINRQSLESKLKEAYLKALDFDWTGWRIPIYIDEQTGQCSLGNWLSQSSWQPDMEELPITVETWNMYDLGYVDKDFDDDDIHYEIDGKVDWYITQLELYYHEEYKYEVN